MIRRLAPLALVALMLSVACTDMLGPLARTDSVRLVVRPSFAQIPANVQADNPASQVDNVHIVLRNASGAIVVDQIVEWPIGQDTLRLDLDVTVSGSESFELTIEGRSGERVLFQAGPTPLQLSTDGETTVETNPVFEYTGPGADVASVSITGAPGSFLAGSGLTLGVTGANTDGTAAEDLLVIWTSLDTLAATVDGDGQLRVRHDAARAVRVEARVAFTAITDTIGGAIRPASLAVEPGSSTLTALDAELSLSSAVLGEDGAAVSGLDVGWSVEDAAVLALSANGGTAVVTARRTGSSWVVASAGGVRDSALVTVVQRVTRVAVDPAEATLDRIGETAAVAAGAFDANDNAVPGAALEWTTRRPDVVTVTDGTLTAVSPGSAWVVASSGDAADSLRATVLNIDPEIAISSPDDGASFEEGELITFQAAASDLEDGDLSSAIVWTSSMDEGTRTGATVTDSLSAGTHTITASVTDQHGGSAAASIQVSVAANTAPAVEITAPKGAVSVVYGTAVKLAGTATDAQDGDLTSAIEWSSSRDGALGTGAGLTVDGLTIGTHEIVATVTDSRGLTGTAARTVTVTNNGPEVAITAPADGATYDEGASITFRGTATDVEDGTLSGRIGWTSSLSGDIGTGASVTTTLQPGSHTITADVTDSHSLTGSATLKVTVKPNTPPTLFITQPDGPTTITRGTLLNLAAEAADAQDGDLSATILWNIQGGATLEEQGSPISVATDDVEPGTYVFEARVTDSHDAPATASVEVTIEDPTYTIDGGVHYSSTPLAGVGVDLFDAGDGGDAGSSVAWAVTSGGDTEVSETPVALTETNGAGQFAFTGLAAGRYVVRVNGPDGYVSRLESDTIDLSARHNIEFHLPKPLVLRLPADGAIVPDQPTLVWTQNAEAARYQVMVRDDDHVETEYRVEGSNSDRPDTTFAVPAGELQPGASYDWWVNAYDGEGNPVGMAERTRVFEVATPTVTIASPGDDTQYVEGTVLSFAASASDGAGGDISGDIVWYSEVEGDRTQIGTGASFTRTLPLGGHIVIARVTVADQVVEDSAWVSIQSNTIPFVNITAPADGDTVSVGTAIAFTVSATDYEDGDLGDQVAWSLLAGGSLGTSESISVTLEAGTHNVVATVTDSHGGTSSDTITVVVSGYDVGGLVTYSTSGIAGVTVKLTPMSDGSAHSDSTATDAEGRYVFSDVPNDSFLVVVVHPPEYDGPARSTVVRVTGASVTQDFALQKSLARRAPANGASVATPNLEWDPFPGAASYRIRVEDGSGTLVESTTVTGDTIHTVTSALTNGSSYSWTVDADDADGHWIGASMGTRTFTFGAPALPPGATMSWTGAANRDWSNFRNWYPARSPGNSDVFHIPPGLTNQPRLRAHGAGKGLILDSGAQLDLDAYDLTLSGNVEANGVMAGASGRLVMTGQGTGGGAGATVKGNVHNLSVQGHVKPAGRLNVSGTLASEGSGNWFDVGADTVTAEALDVRTSAQLRMLHANAHLDVNGNATFAGGDHDGMMTAGELRVGGSLTQAGHSRSFSPSGSHKTVLDGSSSQTVTFTDPGESTSIRSGFNHLEVANASGVALGSSAHAAGSLTLAGSTLSDGGSETLSVDGNVTADASSSLSLNRLKVRGSKAVANTSGYAVAVTELAGTGQSLQAGLPYQDVVVSGTASAGGSRSISGSLTVSGSGSRFDVGGDSVAVGGDFAVQNNGEIRMTNAAGVLDVEGNATFAGADHDGDLTAGRLRVAGALTQGGGHPRSFGTSGTHKTILDGAAAQSVTFAEWGPTDESRFQDLDITNNVGINFASTLHVLGSIEVADAAGEVTGNDTVYIKQNLKAKKEQWKPAVTEFNGSGAGATRPAEYLKSLRLNSSTVLTADLTVGEDLVINGPNGSLDVGPYTVTVGGNLDVRNSAVLVMQDTGVVDIAGGATFRGGSTQDSLTAGTLRVAGDFSQSGDPTAFAPSGSHRTILDGTTAQDVSFADPGSSSSRFHDLEVTNGSGAGVAFQSDAFVNGVLVSSSDVTPALSASGSLLTAANVNVDRLRLDGLRVELNGFEGTSVFDNVLFGTFDPAATQLTVRAHPSSGPFTFSGLTFSTVLTAGSGYYMALRNTDTGYDGSVSVVVTDGAPVAPDSTVFSIGSSTQLTWNGLPIYP